MVALHLPIGLCFGVVSFLNALGWSRYRDANLVPTNPLADDSACAIGVG